MLRVNLLVRQAVGALRLPVIWELKADFRLTGRTSKTEIACNFF